MPSPLTDLPEPKSTKNDTVDSPTLKGLPKPAVDRLQEPRMRFRTIITLICLLRRVLHVKPGGHTRLVLPRITPSQRTQLRILSALATLLVRRDEVTATAGSLERVFVAHNPLTIKSDRPTSCRAFAGDPAHIHTPRPDDLSLDAVMAYLISARDCQTFDEHAKFIMQFVNQFRSGAPPGTPSEGLMRNFMTYVVGSSAPKMFHRLTHPEYSLPYFDAIVQLPTSDVRWISGGASRPKRTDTSFIKILHSLPGVRFLQGLQHDITQPSTDPHWMRLIAELPQCGAEDPGEHELLFPSLWGLTPESEALYTRSTYREFHRLLCLSLLGYRATLGTLVGLSDPTQEDLSGAIDGVCRYLMILRAIAGSSAVVDHLSVVAGASRARRCRETRTLGRPEYTPEAGSLEDFADMDVTDADGPPEYLDTPHARWLRLQVGYLTAVGNIADLSHLGPRPSGPVELVIYTAPSTGEPMAPLMPVIESVVNDHELALRKLGLPYMEMIETALDDLREHAGASVGRTLDLMCQGSGFRGQTHCETILAALMFDPMSGFPMCDRRVIGASGRCCPVCSTVLESFLFHPPINVIGHHKMAVPCALPDNLSLSVVEFVSRGFEHELSGLLRELCILSQRSRTRPPNCRSMDLRALVRGEWPSSLDPSKRPTLDGSLFFDD